VGAALDRINDAACSGRDALSKDDASARIVAAAASDAGLLHMALRAAASTPSLALRLETLSTELESRLPLIFGSESPIVARNSLDGLAVAWAAQHRPQLLKEGVSGERGAPNAAHVWARMNRSEGSAWPAVDCTEELSVERCIAVSGSTPGWQSTGLFALPGIAVAVSMPACDDDEVTRCVLCFCFSSRLAPLLWSLFLSLFLFSYLLSPRVSYLRAVATLFAPLKHP
jgi:hypothetical protein